MSLKRLTFVFFLTSTALAAENSILLENTGVTEHLGAQTSVYPASLPTLLIYGPAYRAETLGQLQKGLSEALSLQTWNEGKQFDVKIITIAEPKLAQEIGIPPNSKPVVLVLTPSGKISHYIYGTSFHAKDLRFALMDASPGQTGNLWDKVLLLCFHFDSNRNAYTINLWRIVGVVLFLQASLLALYFRALCRKKT